MNSSSTSLPQLPPGSRWWSPRYALTSLRKQSIKNFGIALLIAVGVALPTIVFSWSATGIRVTLDDYFHENVYQMQITTDDNDFELLEELEIEENEYPYIAEFDYISSTAGMIIEDAPDYTFQVPVWSQFKDCRVIPVTPELLNKWKGEFEWRGNSSLAVGQIFVAEGFLKISRALYGLDLEVGSIINVDVFTRSVGRFDVFSRGALSPEPLVGLEVAGFYKPKNLNTLLADLFPSFMRPVSITESWPAIGLNDSIMLLTDNLSEEANLRIRQRAIRGGYFNPAVVGTLSIEEMLQGGTYDIQQRTLAAATQILDKYPSVHVKTFRFLESIELVIEAYVRSQSMTLLVIPIVLMSLILSVFTSESSINTRQGEISVLRARGASFNQIISSIMWESVVLAVLGFLLSMMLNMVLTPVMGASSGFLSYDLERYIIFQNRLSIPQIAWPIAFIIVMFLPGLYLLQIQRGIEVSEIGQPVKTYVPEETGEEVVKQWAVSFFLLLTLILVVPVVLNLYDISVGLGVLFVTILLFATAYAGSRFIQQVIARLASVAHFVIGERTLYIMQSLKRRKGKFIPLLVILTLSLTTTTMMLIESKSFEDTITSETLFAFGADLRIESSGTLPLSFGETLLQYGFITNYTPVIQRGALWGNDLLYLEGVDAKDYLSVGIFSSNSFVNMTAEEALENLNMVYKGIILPDNYVRLFNLSLGDSVVMRVTSGNETYRTDFRIMGSMRNAPGFGSAAPKQTSGLTLSSQLGFQVFGDGFALVNHRFLADLVNTTSANLFLVDAEVDDRFEWLCEALKKRHDVLVYSPYITSSTEDIEEVRYFLSGIHGLTAIGTFICAVMGLASIGLFFGSAILDRKPEYAIFRALGATQKQVVSMVLGEFAALVVCSIIISSILGAIVGAAMSSLVFSISPLDLMLPAVLSIPLNITLIILLIEGLIMLAACIYPAQVAGSVGMVEELRNL